MNALAWHRARTFAHDEFSAARLGAGREATVSVCLPARNVSGTIGPILRELIALRDAGLVEQVVVVDGSSDGTAEVARAMGAEVHDQDTLLPELGPVLGKGDAMWRALGVIRGECVCFLDADSEGFGPQYVYGLLGPLLTNPAIGFVKGFYRRPFRVGEMTLPEGGGRVTELTARPLLNLFYPELAAVAQPLAGEIAARRELLERLPFATGYGVDIGLLIDAYRTAGLQALAQVDLGTRQNDHQPLRDLAPMAFAVLQAVTGRLERERRVRGPLPETFLRLDQPLPRAVLQPPLERPPLANLRAAA